MNDRRTPSRRNCKVSPVTRRPRLHLELLEDRVVPTVFNVNSLADVLNPGAGVITLRSAIQAANATPVPDTINLAVSGTYRLTTLGTNVDNTAGELAIMDSGNLSIVNTSGSAVVVDGGGLNRVFDLNPTGSTTPFTVTFQNFTITNGSASPGDGADGSGGGIRAQAGASVVLNSVVLTHNSATADGGGISLESPNNDSTGTLTVNNSIISYNHAGDAGGGIETDGTGQVTVNAGTQVVGNTCVNQGAGIWLDAGGANLTVTGAVINGNAALTMLGGGIGNAGAGNVTITSSLIENNFSGGTGAGFADAANMGNLTVTQSIFLNNTAVGDGGGIQEGGPNTTISFTVFEHNLSQGNGGALFVNGTDVSVTSSRFSHNVAVNGAGLADEAAMVTLTNCTFDRNHTLATADGSGGNGGAIEAPSGVTSLMITNSLFLNNQGNNGTVANGGAIHQEAGDLQISASQFTGNGTGGAGGAVYFTGATLSVTGTTFNANRALGNGGALFFEATGTVAQNTGSTLTNDTFVGNLAGGDGGAIDDVGTGDLALLNDTINGNTAAGNGGGVALTGGPSILSFQNTIVTQDTAGASGPDVFTMTGFTVTDNGGNLIGTLTGSTGFGPGTLSGSPKFGPLENNGGQFAGSPDTRQIVQTEALLPGSPAIGKGVLSGSPTTDERGFHRPGGGATNPSIGAYEPQFAANASANQVYVESLYETLLNRTADSGATSYVYSLNHGGSRTNVVQSIENSTEYRTDAIQALYLRYLHRPADMNGLQNLLHLLATGGTLEQAAVSLIGSTEYFSLRGASPAAFLDSLFEDALNRAPDQGASTAFLEGFGSGLSASQIAGMVVGSTEYAADLIQSDYQALLGRAPSPMEMATQLKALRSGTTDQGLVANLLGSTEAFANRS